jgi:hypothetical protein
MDSVTDWALALTDVQKLELIRALAASLSNNQCSDEWITLLDDFGSLRSELTHEQVWGT